jgi:hypothetical protein
VLCPSTRFIHSSRPRSMNPPALVRPARGCFVPYVAGGPCPPSDYLRRPGFYRLLCPTGYIALFVRHLARTFYSYLRYYTKIELKNREDGGKRRSSPDHNVEWKTLWAWEGRERRRTKFRKRRDLRHHAWATAVCPNVPLIMKSFTAMLAGIYGASTITNYVPAVRV